jgi:hypothetical protein
MSSTLKELYSQKRLLEALDQQKMQQLLQMIGSIESSIQPFRNQLPTLAAAVDSAKQLAGQKLSGQTGILDKIKTNLGIVDDLKDFITFQASILQGLRSIPNVINLLKKGNINLGSGETPLDTIFKSGQGGKSVDTEENRQQIEMTLRKAFSPPAGIFQSKKIPFVNDVNTLVSDFFKLSPNEINQLAKKVGGLGALPISGQELANVLPILQQYDRKKTATFF